MERKNYSGVLGAPCLERRLQNRTQLRTVKNSDIMAKCFLYQRIDRLSMYRDVNKGLLMIESKFQSTIIQHAVIKCLFFYIPDGELVEFELSLADTYRVFFPSLTLN